MKLRLQTLHVLPNQFLCALLISSEIAGPVGVAGQNPHHFGGGCYVCSEIVWSFGNGVSRDNFPTRFQSWSSEIVEGAPKWVSGNIASTRFRRCLLCVLRNRVEFPKSDEQEEFYHPISELSGEWEEFSSEIMEGAPKSVSWKIASHDFGEDRSGCSEIVCCLLRNRAVEEFAHDFGANARKSWDVLRNRDRFWSLEKIFTKIGFVLRNRQFRNQLHDFGVFEPISVYLGPSESSPQNPRSHLHRAHGPGSFLEKRVKPWDWI